MPLDSLPGTLAVPLRNESRELGLRSYRVRNPAALTTENTFPWIDASCQADMVQVILRDAVVVNNGIALKTSRGAYLDQRLAELGLSRLPAVGASGYVAISASAGGTTIFKGDEIKHEATGLRFECNADGLYLDGQSVPVIGKDVGEQTSLDGGTILKWTSPRPGCGSTATVVTQADGVSGLTGGHGIEDDEGAITRAINLRANPPASGNDAEYQVTGNDTPGIGVQQIFTYPGIKGSGSIGFVFTVRPSKPGASRIPSGAQVSAVLAFVTGLMPADDGIYAGTITGQPVDVVTRVTWGPGAPSWVDVAPWPAYYAAAGQAVVVQSAAGATDFVVKTFNSNYSGVAQPAAGQTIGFYDRTGQIFRRKKILSVTGTGPWTITCDTSNAASDTGYVPVVGQRACPWADAMNDAPAALIAYFDGLGPGEQVASFFDPGMRQKRSPASPQFYPSQVSSRLLPALLAVPSVQDAAIAEPALPQGTTVGTAGVLSYLITLNFLSVFPQ